MARTDGQLTHRLQQTFVSEGIEVVKERIVLAKEDKTHEVDMANALIDFKRQLVAVKYQLERLKADGAAAETLRGNAIGRLSAIESAHKEELRTAEEKRKGLDDVVVKLTEEFSELMTDLGLSKEQSADPSQVADLSKRVAEIVGRLSAAEQPDEVLKLKNEFAKLNKKLVLASAEQHLAGERRKLRNLTRHIQLLSTWFVPVKEALTRFEKHSADSWSVVSVVNDLYENTKSCFNDQLERVAQAGKHVAFWSERLSALQTSHTK